MAFAAATILGPLASAACSGHASAPNPRHDAGFEAVASQLKPCADLVRCEEACRKNDFDQCLAAANSYGSGQGAPKDEPRATALFEQACALGAGAGCNLAGRMHEFAHGVPQDYSKALALYERGCGLEYVGACYNVAVLLERGQGAAADGAQARALYQRVCSAGGLTGCEAAKRLEGAGATSR
jgi:TPR repeat protein